MVLTPEPPPSTRQQRAQRSPIVGQRRPRASSEPSSGEDASEDDQRLHSPIRERDSKKGRLYSPPKLLPTQPTPTATSSSVQQSDRPEGLTSKSPTFPDVAVDQTRHLEALLDSVLATLVIIQSASTAPLTLSRHAQEALKTLNKLAPLTSAPSPPMEVNPPKSFAQAATMPAKPTAHRAKAPLAGRTALTRTQPRRHPQAANRVIASWFGHPAPPSASLSAFVDSLNFVIDCDPAESVRTPKMRVLAANVTKAGNIVMHMDTPLSASRMLDHSEFVQRAASVKVPFTTILKHEPELSLDVPWSGVVIHDLPGAMLRKELESNTLWDKLDESPIDTSTARGTLKVLCRDEDYATKERLSLLVRFEDDRVCSRLCKEGTLLFGTWCRVSLYQSQKRRPRHLSSPPTSPPNTS